MPITSYFTKNNRQMAFSVTILFSALTRIATQRIFAP